MAPTITLRSPSPHTLLLHSHMPNPLCCTFRRHTCSRAPRHHTPPFHLSPKCTPKCANHPVSLCYHYPSSTSGQQSQSRYPPHHNHVFSDEHAHSLPNRGIIYITSAALSTHSHSSTAPASLANRGIVHNITSAALNNHFFSHKLSRHTCRRSPWHYTPLHLCSKCTNHPVSLCHHYHSSISGQQSQSRYPPHHNHVVLDEHIHSLPNRGIIHITSAALSNHLHSSIAPTSLANLGFTHDITSAALSNHCSHKLSRHTCSRP